MNGELLVTIVYYFILYCSLSMLAVPVMFFMLWTFTGFFKKHIPLFYVMIVVLFGGAMAGFYFTTHSWIYLYYPFPAWVQIIGLLLFVMGFVVIKIAELTISRIVRAFYPMLKGEKFHLKTTGIYKYLRHPIYAVIPWIVLGSLLYTGQLILLIPLILNLLTRTWFAKKEEAYTKDKVIGDYDAYMKKTPNRFYPKFF